MKSAARTIQTTTAIKIAQTAMSRWTGALVILACFVTAAIVALSAPRMAGAAVSTGASVTVTGPGTKQAGREINARLKLSNTESDPAIAPQRIRELTVTSTTLRWNRRAKKLATCAAAVPVDGSAPACPARSKVGSGRATLLLGFPGMPAATLGPLANVSGVVTVYNYKPAAGEIAHLVAAYKLTAPIPGIWINIHVRISRSGVITVAFPDTAELPPALAAALPAGTRVIVTGLDVTLRSSRAGGRRARPFMSLKTLSAINAVFSVTRD